MMRREPLLCLATVAMLSLTACATPKDPLAAFYSNTWNVYTAHGISHYFVNRDHTWSAQTFDDRSPSGTWSVEGEIWCAHAAGHPDECFAILGKEAGQAWPMTADAEEVVSLLHVGRERGR